MCTCRCTKESDAIAAVSPGLVAGRVDRPRHEGRASLAGKDASLRDPVSPSWQDALTTSGLARVVAGYPVVRRAVARVTDVTAARASATRAPTPAATPPQPASVQARPSSAPKTLDPA